MYSMQFPQYEVYMHITVGPKTNLPRTENLKGEDWQATVCCKVGAAALVHLRPVLGGCTILPFNP